MTSPAPDSRALGAPDARALGAPGSRAQLEDMWSGQVRWWHVSTAALLALIAVVTLLEPPDVHGRWPGLAACLLIGVLYAGVGARAMPQGRTGWAPAYLTAAWAAVVAVQALAPHSETWLFYFVVFPHTWVMLSAGAATATTTLALLASGVARWLTLPQDLALAEVLVTSLITFVLSVLLGLVTSRAFHEADSRAAVIDELRATQAQLAAAEHERGVLAERERLSREIHDTLAQGFASILAFARASDSALARGDIDTARKRLDMVESTATDNLNEARIIVAETTPGHLRSGTLIEALERVVGAVREGADIDATLTVVGTPVPLGAAGDVVVLRAVQECLGNARRHAAATTVRVTLRYADRGPLTVTIVDDGVGFETGAPRAGFGLDGIAARAGEVGGAAVVASRPGSGTTVTVTVPAPGIHR